MKKHIRPNEIQMMIPATPPPEVCVCWDPAIRIVARETRECSLNGQKLPPSGGTIQINEFAPGTSSKTVWINDESVVLGSRIQGVGEGAVSEELQFGPGTPTKDVLPDKKLPWKVKF